MGASARAFAALVVLLATMSFFGFGAAAHAPDLGLVIASVRPALGTAWWPAVFPALVLIALALAARVLAASADKSRP